MDKGLQQTTLGWLTNIYFLKMLNITSHIRGDITSHLSEWLRSKGPRVTDDDEDEVKGECLLTAGRNVS